MDRDEFESLLAQRAWLRTINLHLTAARQELEYSPAEYRSIYKSLVDAELKIQEAQRVIERQFNDSLDEIFR